MSSSSGLAQRRDQCSHEHDGPGIRGHSIPQTDQECGQSAGFAPGIESHPSGSGARGRDRHENEQRGQHRQRVEERQEYADWRDRPKARHGCDLRRQKGKQTRRGRQAGEYDREPGMPQSLYDAHFPRLSAFPGLKEDGQDVD